MKISTGRLKREAHLQPFKGSLLRVYRSLAESPRMEITSMTFLNSTSQKHTGPERNSELFEKSTDLELCRGCGSRPGLYELVPNGEHPAKLKPLK